jgi:hypothetical protein
LSYLDWESFGIFGDMEGYFDGNSNLDLGIVNWVLCLWKGAEALMGVSLLLNFMDEFDF